MAVRTFVRHCWLLLRPVSGPPASFTVTCACGGSVSGVRRPRHQLLPCPLCRQPLFVLPFSRWPVPDGEPAAAVGSRLHAWRLPLLAGLVTLALVLVGCWVLLSSLARDKGPAVAEVVDAIRQRQTAARRALAEGSYHQAFEESAAAKELSDRYPSALDRDERRRLEQFHRQSDVLARLLSEPLQEIVTEATRAQPRDWQARFQQRYQGRSVLFDDRLRADALGRPALQTYEVRLDDEKVRLAVDDLRVLQHLPLESLPRVLFGARLARVVHEPDGWVIHFEPESGVLFTDADAARCVPVDDELLEVLQRQEKWVRTNAEPE